MKYISILLFAAVLPIFLIAADNGYYSCDKISDHGQYTMPRQKFGKSYWTLRAPTSVGGALIIDNLLSESVVGLTALAVNEGRSEVMAWMQVETDVYNRIKSNLPMRDMGLIDTWSLLEDDHIRSVITGYVLYDTTNHESINAASVASHVYGGVMIEKRDVSRIENLGYKCLFDASALSLKDSWRLFKDKCNKNAMVLMPTLTSNQRSTAIAYRLMVVNLNKVSYQPKHGSNKQLIVEILKELKPLSPVFGWEQAVGEDAFVGLVSSTGNFMVPYDWTHNTPLISAQYENRQKGVMKITDPRKINYGDARHYMSYYMSDGDNVQWMFGAYDKQYLTHPEVGRTKMSFGFPLVNLSMVSPDHCEYLLKIQRSESSLIENFGGGYYYADQFAELKDRAQILDAAAKNTAIHMRQHRCKILSLVCMDVFSEGAKQAYKAFIDRNDQLIGIVVIQYSPYAGGAGETMWFTNKKGLHIPVVTVRYSLWNYGEGQNGEVEGTPAYIASKYNRLAAESEKPTFSATSVHAWSHFTKTENAEDLTAENAAGGTVFGVGSAVLCSDRLSSDVKVVNLEELIWQLRMNAYPAETKKLLQLK